MKRHLSVFLVCASLGAILSATPIRQDMTTAWTYLMNQVYSGAWDDLVTVAGATNPIGADGQATVNNDATAFIGCLEFDAAGETAVAQFQLPHAMKANQDIKPHLHWAASGVDVTGSSVFAAKFRHCPLNGTCTVWTDWENGTVSIEPADVEGGTGLTSWTLADSTYDFGISDVVLMQFKLVSTTITDSMVCSVDTHLKRDALGSANEASR